MSAISAESAPPPRRGWPRQKWFFLVVLAVAAHVALIFTFGARHPVLARAVTHAPRLQLAVSGDDLIALTDPTLFILPHANDFSAAIWQKSPGIAPPSFLWTESPQWLTNQPEQFGANFREFMETNHFTEPPLTFKPEPEFTTVTDPFIVELPTATTLQITGDLALRQAANQIPLPSLPCNDVLSPSRVQALVDANGTVISVVLLESSSLPEADQRALLLARQLRFKPANRMSLGEITFRWHTVPQANP